MFDESLLMLRGEVGKLLQAGIKFVIFDFSDVPHCDSSGCGEMIGAYTSIRRAGGNIAITAAGDRIRMLWKRIHLEGVFNLFTTIGEAESFLKQNSAI